VARSAIRNIGKTVELNGCAWTPGHAPAQVSTPGITGRVLEKNHTEPQAANLFGT
jgi:hypothetical protein